MTQRLYYENHGLLEFEAVITKAGKSEDGYYTILDKSAFYPTSGGQQFDTGYLDGVRIIDVVETDEGEVKHISKEPVGDPGQKVGGKVDSERRGQHRRQHSAQHVISQGFVTLYDFETVSVHLGEDYGAVELNTKEVSEEQLAKVEDFCREVVFKNYFVSTLFLEREQLKNMPLRKIPERSGRIRVITIGDLDYSACGGTHVNSTAEIGMIKIIGTEKMRGQVLVKFLCGAQSAEDYRKRYEVSDKLAQMFTCHYGDLPENIGKLNEENKELRKEIARLQKELMPQIAEKLATDATTVKDHRMVVKEVSGVDKKSAGILAGMVAEKTQGLAVLISDGKLIVATSEKTDLDAGKIAKAVSARTSLKGGGNNRQAQLGGELNGDAEFYHKLFSEILTDEF